MTDKQQFYARLAFVLALVAMAGSLYFSEIAAFPPCKLCWFQRMAVFPAAILLGVGLVRKDAFLHVYILALTLPALLISVYHNLLYYKLIPGSLAPCEAGVSCTTKYIEWLGFITIPMLSLAALVGLTLLMYLFRKEGRSV